MGMGDLALVWEPTAGSADLAIDAELEDLLEEEGLRTSALLSLFCDRRAEPDDELPDGTSDRRGWWADEFAEVENDLIGSRLWLLDRSKRLGNVPVRCEEFVREALAWFLEDIVASEVEVVAETDGDRLAYLVTLHRPDAAPVSFRFAHVWEAEASRGNE